MKFVLTGSLGNIGKPLATELAENNEVVVISSEKAKTPQIEAIGAAAAIGSVEDVDFLTQTFEGADIVFLLVPPKWDAEDWKEYIQQIGKNYAKAVQRSGVKKLIHLSSIGAHMATGAGPVSGIHRVENELNHLQGVDVLFLRPSFFYTNFLANINMIKQMNILGANYGERTILPLVHPRDIAAVAAEEFKKASFTGKSIRYIVSDERSVDEIARVIGAAIGKPELPWINFSDEDQLKGLLGAGLSQEVAVNYTEMGHGVATGEMISDLQHHLPIFSPTKLEDFAKEFAAAFLLS